MVRLIKRILSHCISIPRDDENRLHSITLEDLPDCLLRSISYYLDLHQAASLSVLNIRFQSIFKLSRYHSKQLHRHRMDWYFHRNPPSDIRRFLNLTHLDLTPMALSPYFDTNHSSNHSVNESMYDFNAFQSITTLNIPNCCEILESIHQHLYSSANIPLSLCSLCIEAPIPRTVNLIPEWFQKQSFHIIRVLLKFSNITDLQLTECHITFSLFTIIATEMSTLSHLSLHHNRYSIRPPNDDALDLIHHFIRNQLIYFHFNDFHIHLLDEWTSILQQTMTYAATLKLRFPFSPRTDMDLCLSEWNDKLEKGAFQELVCLEIDCHRFNDHLVSFLNLIQFRSTGRGKVFDELKIVFGRADNVNIYINFPVVARCLNALCRDQGLQRVHLQLHNTDALQIVVDNMHQLEDLNGAYLSIAVTVGDGFSENVLELINSIIRHFVSVFSTGWKLSVLCEMDNTLCRYRDHFVTGILRLNLKQANIKMLQDPLCCEVEVKQKNMAP